MTTLEDFTRREVAALGEKLGVAAPPAADIFTTIARNIFTTRGLEIDDAWADTIADEYRRAMADLSVEVKPKGSKPDAERSTAGHILLLLAAIENRDVTVGAVEIPVASTPSTKPRPIPHSTINIDVGRFVFHVEYTWVEGRKTIYGGHIRAITLPGGERRAVSTKLAHPLSWLGHYWPTPGRNLFSLAVQHSIGRFGWTVRQIDHEQREWAFDPSTGPRIVRDARGREL